jgi:hypothetical protein
VDQRRHHPRLGEEQADVDEQGAGGIVAEVLRRRQAGEDEVEGERQRLCGDEAGARQADPADDGVGEAAAAGLELRLDEVRRIEVPPRVLRGGVGGSGVRVILGGQPAILRFGDRTLLDAIGRAGGPPRGRWPIFELPVVSVMSGA